jgi:hypothetical protein
VLNGRYAVLYAPGGRLGELLTGLFELVAAIFESFVASDSEGRIASIRADSAGKRDRDSHPTGAA